jgi:hypothetical protein
MKSLASLLILVVALVLVGGVLWYAGKNEEQLAAAEYSFLTLRYETAATQLDEAAGSSLLRPLLSRLGVASGNERASAQYWLGDYEGLALSDDPALKLLAANAEYRALRTAGGQWQAVVARLDSIAKRYADILRTDPDSEDAAYNLEFIVRVRAAMVAAKKPLPANDPADSGLTIHGWPGAPPEEMDGKKFKMIVPMLPDERQEAEEAGRAGRKVRKG